MPLIIFITLFASIAFLNLPKIQGSFALSSAAYELAQNIRTAENMSTSGLKTDSSGNATAGFGIFIDLSSANRLTKNYKMYADNCPVGNPDQLYSASGGCTDDSSIIGVDKNNAGISMNQQLKVEFTGFTKEEMIKAVEKAKDEFGQDLWAALQEATSQFG